MKTTAEVRTDFGLLLKALRTRRNLSLRGLDEACGLTYSVISALEHGDRAVGGDAATRLADALQLQGEEREHFLFLAAGTRRKDRLVGYARTLAPELVNFVPRVLMASGINLREIDRCEVRSDSSGELPLRIREALTETKMSANPGPCLVLNAGGREFVCTLLMVPAT